MLDARTVIAIGALALAAAALAACGDDAPETTAPAPGSVGAACETDNDCLNGLFCNPFTAVCTEPLEMRDVPTYDTFVPPDTSDDEDVSDGTDTPEDDTAPQDTAPDDTSDTFNDVGGPCTPGETMTCGFDLGECHSATQVCDENGQWSACEATLPQPEICDDLDNDCDGRTDEELQRECGTDTGTCQAGVQACVQGVWGSCKDAAEPEIEQCDGLDNDCNDIVDNGVARTCTVNGCEGIETCVVDGTGEWGPCQPTAPMAEVCDGLDNDCDGVADNGVCGGVCGDGTLDAGEQCDDGNTVAGDGCSATCTDEMTSCPPDDAWTLSPGVAYSCTFGLVNLNYSTFNFALAGSGLRVNEYMNGGCRMSGALPDANGNFTLTCLYAGSCDEEYTLTGTFTDCNTWTGTLTVTYTGDCFDCTNQTWNLTGTRQ